MKTNQLIKVCDLFLKTAQQNTPIVLDPKSKNINFYSNFLYNTIVSYANKFKTPTLAKKVFDSIAAYHKSQVSNSDRELREVKAILGAINECELKLKNTNIDPVNVLRKKGMTNVNPNILNILKNNLNTMLEATDFAKYQQYYLVFPGEAHPKDVIEIDNYEPGPGY